MQERHGDVFELRLGASEPPLLMVGDPQLVKQVFNAPPEVLRAGEGNRRGLGWIHREHALALLDGERHTVHRRLLAPAFHGRRLERHATKMRELAEAHVERWPAGEEVAALPRLRALTREVALEAVLGDGDRERLGALDAILHRLQEPAAVDDDGAGSQPPTARLVALMAAEVRSRRNGPQPPERPDMLSLLLEARCDDGAPLSEAEVRDEAMALLVTASETTAAGLAWALERLARNLDALATAARDAGDRDTAYVEATICEALRARPPVTMSARLVKQPFQLGERVVEPGTLIALSALLVHHRPDVYPEPMAFRPERFLGRRPGAYAWIPFGGGARRCVGAGFAQMEMRIVLSTLLAAMELRPAPPEPEAMRTVGSRLIPAEGARVTLERRATPGAKRARRSRWSDAAVWSGEGLRREVFFFRSAGVELYGSLYAAAEPSRPFGVVACQSWGIEADRTDPLVRNVALSMARLGGAGLVFHYPGYGDSFGDLAEVSLADLVSAAADAVEEGSRRCPGLSWILAGFMFGAATAALTRQRQGGELLLVQPEPAPGAYLRRLAETTQPVAPGPSPREMRKAGSFPGMAYGYPVPGRIAAAAAEADAEVAAALAAYEGEGAVVRHAAGAAAPPEALPERLERVEVAGAWRFGSQNHPGLANAAAEWLDRRTQAVRP